MTLPDLQIPRDLRLPLRISAVILLLFFTVAIKIDFILSFAVFTGLALALIFCWLLVKYPGYGVGVMIIGTSLDQLGKIPGTPITLFHIGFIVSIGCWLIQRFNDPGRPFRRTNFDLPLILFLAMISFSLLYTPDQEEAIVQFLRLVALVGVMYVTVNVIEDRVTLGAALAALVLSAVALSGYALSSLGSTSSSLMQLAVGFSKVFGRFGATFENPNYFASYLMLALSVAMAFIVFGGVHWSIRLLLLPASVLMLVAMVGTFSRAAWVAMLAAAAVIIFNFRYRWIILIALVVLFLLAVPFLWSSAFFQSFVMRFTSISDASADPSSMTRVFLFRGGLSMLLDSYLLGVGYRGFPVYYERSYIPHNQVLYDVFESHTLPMEVLAELGIIGFALFFWLLKRYFQFAISVLRSFRTPYLRASYIGVVAAMTGYFVNALFSPGQLSGNFLWIGFGLTYAIPRLERPEKVGE